MTFEEGLAVAKELYRGVRGLSGLPFIKTAERIALRLKKLNSNDLMLVSLFHHYLRGGEYNHLALIARGVPPSVAIMAELSCLPEEDDCYCLYFKVTDLAKTAPEDVLLIMYSDLLDHISMQQAMCVRKDRMYKRKWNIRMANVIHKHLPKEVTRKIVGGSVDW